MQLPPSPQRSGSLKAMTAVVLYVAIEVWTLDFQTEVRSEAVDQSMGTYSRAGL